MVDQGKGVPSKPYSTINTQPHQYQTQLTQSSINSPVIISAPNQILQQPISGPVQTYANTAIGGQKQAQNYGNTAISQQKPGQNYGNINGQKPAQNYGNTATGGQTSAQNYANIAIGSQTLVDNNQAGGTNTNNAQFTIEKSISTEYDPFYSPILEKVDAIFSKLGVHSEGCRERLICSMYKNPGRFSPHSNLLSAELSR